MIISFFISLFIRSICKPHSDSEILVFVVTFYLFCFVLFRFAPFPCRFVSRLLYSPSLSVYTHIFTTHTHTYRHTHVHMHTLTHAHTYTHSMVPHNNIVDKVVVVYFLDFRTFFSNRKRMKLVHSTVVQCCSVVCTYSWIRSLHWQEKFRCFICALFFNRVLPKPSMGLVFGVIFRAFFPSISFHTVERYVSPNVCLARVLPRPSLCIRTIINSICICTYIQRLRRHAVPFSFIRSRAKLFTYSCTFPPSRARSNTYIPGLRNFHHTHIHTYMDR